MAENPNVLPLQGSVVENGLPPLMPAMSASATVHPYMPMSLPMPAEPLSLPHGGMKAGLPFTSVSFANAFGFVMSSKLFIFFQSYQVQAASSKPDWMAPTPGQMPYADTCQSPNYEYSNLDLKSAPSKLEHGVKADPSVVVRRLLDFALLHLSPLIVSASSHRRFGRTSGSCGSVIAARRRHRSV